jgi:hypothetical protein
MASFDFIETSVKGYRFAWGERRYIARLAAMPLLIKFVCFVSILSLGWEQEYLKQAIVMLPSFFAEGWLVCHIIRLIFLDQRWPFRPTGDEKKDMEVIEDRARGIMSGTIMYVLIKFILTGGLSALSVDQSMLEAPTGGEVDQQPLIMLAMSVALLVFMVWAFRFMWLYIPVALNYSIPRYLRDVQGYSTSFYMIGTWLICFFPITLVLIFASLLVIVPGAEGEISTLSSFTIAMMQVFIDTVIAIVATAGMAFSIQEMVIRSDKSSQL